MAKKGRHERKHVRTVYEKHDIKLFKNQIINNVYKYFKDEKKRGSPRYSIGRVLDRTADALGLPVTTVDYNLHQYKGPTSTKQRVYKDSLDTFDYDLIRRTVYDMMAEKILVTLKRLRVRLEKNNLLVSKIKLWKALHKLGFQYKVDSGEGREMLCERGDLVAARARYLRDVERLRKDGYTLVWLDETYINANHVQKKQWIPPAKDRKKGLKVPSGKGERLIIVHAMSKEDGLLPNCALVFQGKKNDNSDYHTEMNAACYNEWVNNQLIPNLPREKCCIIQDNASYHNTRTEETTCPTSATLKPDMQKWLKKRNITFPKESLKPELYELIKRHKPEPEYEVTKILKQHGHESVRLPAYHCVLNPIEQLWGTTKGNVSRNNTTFKLNDVRDKILAEFDEMTAEKCRKYVEHVERVEEDYKEKDGLLPEVEPMIIRLDDSSDESSDEEETLLYTTSSNIKRSTSYLPQEPLADLIKYEVVQGTGNGGTKMVFRKL